MQNLTQPTLLLKPFCQDGDKNQIPVQNDSLVDPQLADLTNGFPEITSRPPSQGGLPPERRDFNALGYLTTSYDWFYQAGGTFTFNQVISDSIGGYPLNARLWYTNSDGISMILRSTIANNTNNFLNDSSVIGAVGSGKPWVIENFSGVQSQYDILEYKYSANILNDIKWLRSDTFSWQSGAVYATAYQHLVDDIDGKTPITRKLYARSNVSKIGYIAESEGVISNFLANTSYATHPAVKPVSSFEYVVKVRQDILIANTSFLESLASQKGLILRNVNASTGQINIWVGTGSAWTISNVNTNCPLTVGVWNWYKVSWDGTTLTVAKSLDGINYTVGLSQALTLAIDWDTNKSQGIGGAAWESYPFLCGQVDLNETYLNIDGARYWTGCDYNTLQYYQADDGHVITTADYENVVNTMYLNHFPDWIFVLDTVNQRFKLPRDANIHGNVYETYQDSAGGYRLYDDGFIEQWGNFGAVLSSWTTRYVVLYKEMENKNYSITTMTGNTDHTDSPCINAKNVGSFSCIPYNSSGNACWYVSGYAADKPTGTNVDKKYLYFFVGNYSRGAIEQTAGINTELFNQKMDNDRIQQVSELPENPVFNVLYLIPE